MSPPRAKTVKFVASDPSRGGLPVKRKQVQQACVPCRRKKRRCIHAGDDSASSAKQQRHGDLSLAQTLSPTATPSTPTPACRPVSSYDGDGMDSTSATLTRGGRQDGSDPPTAVDVAVASQPSRFVGDLNPEGMFLEATTREAQNGDAVGIWLSSSASGAAEAPSQFITSRPPPIMDRFLLPFVREHCLSCLPSPDDYAKFEALYLAKIDPIIPMVSRLALQGSLAVPCNVISRQIVCLAAASDAEMAPHLRLRNKLLSPHEFSQALSSAVRTSLETSITADRLVHIQALVILSLYTQPTCAEEADLPAQLGGRAIHHVQTLGLHLLRYDGPNCHELNNLFCAVWALDRINAAVYGRPYLIHERDIGADINGCIRRCPPCFRLFLFIIQWLEQIIELYRPGPSAEASGLKQVTYIDMPMLEAMIVDADALKVPSHLIATLETFFHAAVILSCRLPRPGTPSAASTLPPASASARRSLAADRIASAVSRHGLSPLPLVPYALSLALSVEYRKMRHSRLPMFRTRSMLTFRRNCELLGKFGDYFWSAKVVSGLGERVLKEMERAASALNKEVTPPPPDAETRSDGVSAEIAGGYSSLAANSTVGLDHGVDFSLIDAVAGQDIFGHMDPNFDLNAVEDALEANLDIGLPLNWGEWDQFGS